MNEKNDTFGVRLREQRTKRNMSQEEMARLLGTSKQVISRYENGLRIPKITIANEYASILGVSLTFLMGKSESESMSSEDDELVRLFKSLPKDKQIRALEFARFLHSQEQE